MKAVITGGLGFVGSALIEKFMNEGISVSVVERKVTGRKVPEGVRIIEADTSSAGSWQEEVAGNDIIVNLAGASIFTRWSKASKSAIYESRIFTTKNIVQALQEKPDRKFTLINASAVGYYGFHGDEILDEYAEAGDDFLAIVARDWEKEALEAESENIRVILCRFGIVLGSSGGALGLMNKLFSIYLGTRLGSGRQWFSWIYLEDLVSAIRFLAVNADLKGPFNCASPNPVTNSELTRALSRVLKKPVIFPFAPAFAVKLILGEFGDTLLKGQRVIPGRLMDSGFEFRYPVLNEALRAVFGK